MKIRILILMIFFNSYLLVPQNSTIDRMAKTVTRIEKEEDFNQKMALIIGVSSYSESLLKNPINDATDIADVLYKCGFEVTLKTDVDQQEMDKAIKNFSDKLKNKGIGLFYFAGHGIQYEGYNYLIPAKANIEDEIDIKSKSISANYVLDRMAREREGMNIIILDACRNNPIFKGSRSFMKGLAQMDAPVGTLIVYSTGPGKTAADGTGRNGLYTNHLLTMIKETNLEIMALLRKVRENVKNETNGQQIPWEASSLLGSFYFSYTDTQLKKNQAEITEIQAQLTDLVKQRKELEEKKKIQESWESERKEEEKRALLKAKQLEAERLLKEKERSEIREKQEMSLFFEEEKRREQIERQKKASEEELIQLREKFENELVKIENIKKDVLSMEEAQKEIKLLEMEIDKASSLILPIKEKELVQLKTDYDSLLIKLHETPIPPKNQFETNADFGIRVKKYREKIKTTEEQYNKEYIEINKKYDEELESLTKKYYDKIDEIVNRKYMVELLLFNLIKYDAERKIYRVQIIKPFKPGWFLTLSIEPGKARELFEKRSLIRVEGYYKSLKETNSLGEVFLITPDGERYKLISTGIKLRSEYTLLSKDEIVNMVRERSIFDSYDNSGAEFKNDFEIMKINNDTVVFDYATNLIWHGTVIPAFFNFGRNNFKTIPRWIEKQNNKSYAFIKDWRLPTLEEAGTLLKIAKNRVNRLHITPLFVNVNFIITGDKDKKSNANWIINFNSGRIKIQDNTDGEPTGIFLVHPMQ